MALVGRSAVRRANAWPGAARAGRSAPSPPRPVLAGTGRPAVRRCRRRLPETQPGALALMPVRQAGQSVVLATVRARTRRGRTAVPARVGAGHAALPGAGAGGVRSGVTAHTGGMPVRLHHIVVALMTCPGWPGSWRRCPAGGFFLSGSAKLSSGQRARPAAPRPHSAARWRYRAQAREFFVVPRGAGHCPRAGIETAMLLLEPAGVVTTGDAGGELTAGAGTLA